MGKANRGGQKRKEAPARKQLQGRGGNSGLLHKNKHGKNLGAHRAAGLDGGATMGKRTLAQQLLQPNKRSRGGKRRRKSDGPGSKPRSSEAAAIQAEYAAVDAREKAKKDAEKARRLCAPVRIRLAPSTTALRMPSEGEMSMASLRASSSARMVEALLESITDDRVPDAPTLRPVRSAGRKRKGNPYSVLGENDDDDSDSDNESLDAAASGGYGSMAKSSQRMGRPSSGTSIGGAFGSGTPAERPDFLAFAPASSFTGFTGMGDEGGAGGGRVGSVGVWSSGGGEAAMVAMGEGPESATAASASVDVGGGDGDSEDDPDL